MCVIIYSTLYKTHILVFKKILVQPLQNFIGCTWFTKCY